MDDVFCVVFLFFLLIIGLILVFSPTNPSPEEIRCTDSGGVWIQKHCLEPHNIPVKEK